MPPAPAMSGCKTRYTSGSNLSDLIGKGKEFLASELPTARDVLQLGLFMKETDNRPASKYPVSELINDIYIQLHSQWMKANHLFEFPVIITEKAVKTKLKVLWSTATLIANKGKISKVKEIGFEKKLDTLFDLLHCRCNYYSCICKREMKIPAADIEFIKAQREKVGSKGKLAIGAADTKETKRQTKQIERKEKDIEQEEKRIQQQREEQENIEVVESQEDCDNAENSEEESSTETKDGEPKRKRCIYNTHKIVNIALASLCNGAGLRQAAELATATLIDYQIVTQEDTTETSYYKSGWKNFVKQQMVWSFRPNFG